MFICTQRSSVWYIKYCVMYNSSIVLVFCVCRAKRLFQRDVWPFREGRRKWLRWENFLRTDQTSMNFINIYILLSQLTGSDLTVSSSGNIALAVLLSVAILALLAILTYCFLKSRKERSHRPVATGPAHVALSEQDTLVYNSTTKPIWHHHQTCVTSSSPPAAVRHVGLFCCWFSFYFYFSVISQFLLVSCFSFKHVTCPSAILVQDELS